MWYFVASSLVVTVPVSLPPLSFSLKNLFKALLLSCRGSWIPWSMLIARIYFPNLGDDTVVVCLVHASQLRCKEQTRNYFLIDGETTSFEAASRLHVKKVLCEHAELSWLENVCNSVSSWTRKGFCHLSDGKVFIIKNTAIMLHILLTDHYYFNS